MLPYPPIALPVPPVRGADLSRVYTEKKLDPPLSACGAVDPEAFYLQILPISQEAHNAPYVVGKDVVGLVFSRHFVELFSEERIAMINAALEDAGAGVAAITTPPVRAPSK